MILLSVLLLIYFLGFLFFYYGSLDGIFSSSSNLRANSTTSLATTRRDLGIAFESGFGSLWRFRRAWLFFVIALILILLLEIPRYVPRADPHFSPLDNALNSVIIPGYKLLTSPVRALASLYNAAVPFTNAWAGIVRVFWNSAFEILLECKLVDWNALTSNLREFFFESYVSILNFLTSHFDSELDIRSPLNKLRIAFLHGMGLFDCECHMLRNLWNLVEIVASPEMVEEIHQYGNLMISIALWPFQILRDVALFVYEVITLSFGQAFQNWYWKPQRGFDFARSVTHLSRLIANTGMVVDNAIAVLAEAFGAVDRSDVPKISSLVTERIAQVLDFLNIAAAAFVRYPLRTAITWISKYLQDSTQLALGKIASKPVFGLIDIWRWRYQNLSIDITGATTSIGTPLIDLCDHSISCVGSQCCSINRWKDFGNRLGRAIEAFGRAFSAGRNVLFVLIEGGWRIFATLHYTCFFCEERGGTGRQEIHLIVDASLDEIRIEAAKMRDAIEDLLEIIDVETAQYYREATHVTESIVDLIRALATSSRGGRLARRRYMHSEQYLQDVDRIFFETEASFVALANIIRQFAFDFPLSKRADRGNYGDSYCQSAKDVAYIRTQEASKRRSSIDYRAYVTNKQTKSFATTCAFRDPHSVVIDFHPVLADAENSTIGFTIPDVYTPPDIYVEPLCCIGNAVEEIGLLVAGVVKSLAEVVAIPLHASSLKEAAIELLRGPFNLRRDVIPLVDVILRDQWRSNCVRLGMLRLISEKLDFLGLPATCTSGSEPYALLLRIMTRFIRSLVKFILEVLQLGIDILLSFVDGTAAAKFRAYFTNPATRGLVNKKWYVLTIGQLFSFLSDLLDLIGCSAEIDGMPFFTILIRITDFFADDGIPNSCANANDDVTTFTDFICKTPHIVNRVVDGVLAIFSGDFIGFLRDLFAEFFTDALSCSHNFSTYFSNWLVTIPYAACAKIRDVFPRLGNWQPFAKICYKLDVPLRRVYDANYELFNTRFTNCEGNQPLVRSCTNRWWHYRNHWTYYDEIPRCFRPSRQMPFGCFRTRFSDRQWLGKTGNDLGCCGVPTGANTGIYQCCGGRNISIDRRVDCEAANTSCCSTNGNWCFIAWGNNYCRRQYGDEGDIHLPGDKSNLALLFKKSGLGDNMTADFGEVGYNNTAGELVPYINFTDPESFSAVSSWCLTERYAMEALYQDLTPAFEQAESDEARTELARKRGLDQAGERYIDCMTTSSLLSLMDQSLIMATEEEGSTLDIREFARDPSRTLFTPSTAFSNWKLAMVPINFVSNFPLLKMFSGRAAEAAIEAGSDELYVRLAKLADNGVKLYNDRQVFKSRSDTYKRRALPDTSDASTLPTKRRAESVTAKLEQVVDVFFSTWSDKFSQTGSVSGRNAGMVRGVQAVRDLVDRRMEWHKQGAPAFAEPFPRGTSSERHLWADMLYDEIDFVESGEMENAVSMRARRAKMYPGIEQEHIIMENAELAASESRHLRSVYQSGNHAGFSIDNVTAPLLKSGKKSVWDDWRADSCLSQEQVGDCVQSRLQTIICPATDGIANLEYCETRPIYDFSGEPLAGVRCRTAITPLGIKPTCEKYELIDAEGYCCNVFNPANSIPTISFSNCSSLGSGFRFIEDPLDQLDQSDFLDICTAEYAFYCFNGTQQPCTQISSSAQCPFGLISTGLERCGPFQTTSAACCVNSTCRLSTLANCESLAGVWHYGQSCSDGGLHGSCGHCSAPTCQRCDIVMESVNDLVDLWVFAIEDVSAMRYGACCRSDGTCDVTNASACPLDSVIDADAIRTRRELPPVCIPGVNCRVTIWRWGQDCDSCWFVNDTGSLRDPDLLRKDPVGRVITSIGNNFQAVLDRWNTDSDPDSNFELFTLNLTRSGDLPDRIRLRVGVRFIFWMQSRVNALLGLFDLGPVDFVLFSSQMRYFFDLKAPRSDPRTLKYWFLIAVTCDPINHSRCDRAPFGLGLPLGLFISTLIVGILGLITSRLFPSIWGAIATVALVVIFLWLVVILSWGVSFLCFRPPSVALFKARTETSVPRVVAGQRVSNRLRASAGDRVGAANANTGKWTRRVAAGGRALIRYPVRAIKFVLRTSWNLPVLPNCAMNETVELIDYEASCYEPSCTYACPHRENVWPCGWIPALPENVTCSPDPDCCGTSPCPFENENRLFPDCTSDPYGFSGPDRTILYYLSWLSRSLNDRGFTDFALSNSATLADASADFPDEAFTDRRWRHCAASEIPTIVGVLMLVIVVLFLVYVLALPISRILLVSAIALLHQLFGKFDSVLAKLGRMQMWHKW